MRFKIEMSYQTNTNPHFFQEKTTTSLVPDCARVVVLDGKGPIAINDEVKESERAAVTTMVINNKTDFEKVSSTVLEKFVVHLKENYPNLKNIVDYNEKSLDNLIQINKLKEDILHKEHVLVPQLVQRICASNSENKIQVLEQLNTFLQNATEQQLGQLENKISQLDQRQHYFSDLIKSIGSIVVGWSVGLRLLYIATSKLTEATPHGLVLGLLGIAAGSAGGFAYGADFLNSGAEDIHYPENDKIADIGTICSKM
ncbi:hypothetical protein [Legionella parisiensis]|uniref:Uncharacterized protein n=1 Tax=Legionella parisiensis TaxID=45071 RepID=A0A1E5JX16_9GAMM|nr:hypothetical protein [Legionella parisiensis]KTD40130.1 hypothetical protein Lpar_1447 [Legionella parisiensis]OEH48628.1 hypothetical protein lpari_00387 [Legionella parisiensis]STX77325.1 Uncharacterised protein [Legionella parisiensis]